MPSPGWFFPVSLRPRLRLQITALALTVVLPIIAFGSAVVLYWYGERQAATERALYQKSSEITEAIDRLIAEQIRVLRSIAFSRTLDRPDLAAFHEIATRVSTENPEWANLILIDPETGQQLVNLSRPAGAALARVSDPASVAQIIRTREPQIVAKVKQRDVLTGLPLVGIRVPVIRDDKVRYVIGLVIRLSALERAIAQQQLPESWTAAVLDPDGTIIARNRSTDAFFGRMATADLRGAIARNEYGLFPSTTQEGIPVYTVLQRSPLTGWLIALGVPRAEVDLLHQRETLGLIGAGLASVFGAALIALLLGHIIAQGRETLERQRQLQETQRTLAEKDALLREIHHRVKNNLQVIASLLRIQAHRLAPELQGAFQDSIRRIGAMGRVHDQLYRTTNLARIDLRRYLEGLVAEVATANAATRRKITCTVEGDTTELDLDTATPLGLIVSEALANAFKYAFPENRPGLITVTSAVTPEQIEITVRDNGVGFDGKAQGQIGGIGLELMRRLAESLDATFTTESKGTTAVRIAFRPRRGEPGAKVRVPEAASAYGDFPDRP